MIRAGRGWCGSLIGALLACAGAGEAGGSARRADLRVLETSQVRDEVAAAAIRVAGSGDTAALGRLGTLLAEPAFLARLDETANPQLANYNVGRVFSALAKKPSPAMESLCLRVSGTAAFDVRSDRARFVLEALSEVRPMSAAGVALYSRTNSEGYYASNGILLASNGSDRAMALLDSMFADRSRRVVDRIDLARHGVVSHRTAPAMVRMVDALTRRPDLEPEVAIALAECLFDYRADEWYGKRRNPPIAPAWSAAKPEARRAAETLGRRLLAAHPDWPESLRTAIASVKD